jgi:hypothetical protein
MWLCLFLNSTVGGWGGQSHDPAALTPPLHPGVHRTGRLLGPKSGLDRCGKEKMLCSHMRSNPEPFSPNDLPYRLCYTGPFYT